MHGVAFKIVLDIYGTGRCRLIYSFILHPLPIVTSTEDGVYNVKAMPLCLIWAIRSGHGTRKFRLSSIGIDDLGLFVAHFRRPS